jgi:hypothetical protein
MARVVPAARVRLQGGTLRALMPVPYFGYMVLPVILLEFSYESNLKGEIAGNSWLMEG